MGWPARCCNQPSFPAEHVERLRAQLLTGLSIRDQDTADRASMAFEEIIFPNHPYGLPSDGYVETIQQIGRADLVDFHARYYGPHGMVMVVVGALEASEVIEEVQRTLGGWRIPTRTFSLTCRRYSRWLRACASILPWKARCRPTW